MAPAIVLPVPAVQGSLLGLGAPSVDHDLGGLTHHQLGAGAWVEHLPGWVDGHQHLFDHLLTTVEWQAHRRPMYERMVDVPRLTGSLPEGGGPELSLVAEMAEVLGRRYDADLCRIGLALYRDGRDSVAWHGDTVARRLPQALVATVSLGEPRPFRLRPRGGGPGRSFNLGHGDLVVMGGTCQRTWEHAVPKVSVAGPRITVMFRPEWGPDGPAAALAAAAGDR